MGLKLASLRFGSLSFAPKPLPPFQGLSTGRGHILVGEPGRDVSTVVSIDQAVRRPCRRGGRVGLLAEQPDQAQPGQVASRAARGAARAAGAIRAWPSRSSRQLHPALARQSAIRTTVSR